MLLHTYYNLGGDSGKMGGWASGFGRETFSYLQGWFYYPSVPDRTSILAIPIGLLTVIGLALLRSRFLWWPFHPLGYPVSCVFGGMWFSVFIALVLKTTILKYGGPLLLARLRPIFLGLILGEASVGGFWVVVDAFTGMQSNTLRGVFFG